MALHRRRPSAESYGHAIGILVLETSMPFVPGDVRNAGTYGYPVLYRSIAGISRADCIAAAPKFAELVIAAARALEAQGVKGIVGDESALAVFQDQVREAVRVPVCLSGLLQLPTIARTLAPERPIAILAPRAADVPAALLTRPDISVPNPIVICGMENQSEFRSAVLEARDTLDSDRIEAEAVDVARRLRAEHSDLGAVLLEGAMLPPYARAIQRAIDLPVYDAVTMIDFLQVATHRERYIGYY
ncbi:MAG TPA: hypothetical protein VMG55_19570 [Stellaceae bacterium]|nr:hypothetical protein [Stellaceae bacterium]